MWGSTRGGGGGGGGDAPTHTKQHPTCVLQPYVCVEGPQLAVEVLRHVAVTRPAPPGAVADSRHLPSSAGGSGAEQPAPPTNILKHLHYVCGMQARGPIVCLKYVQSIALHVAPEDSVLHKVDSSRVHNVVMFLMKMTHSELTAHHASAACIFLRSMSTFSASLQVSQEPQRAVPHQEGPSRQGQQMPHSSAQGLLWLIEAAVQDTAVQAGGCGHCLIGSTTSSAHLTTCRSSSLQQDTRASQPPDQERDKMHKQPSSQHRRVSEQQLEQPESHGRQPGQQA